MKQQGFLPATKEELRERGITQPDFVYVIGDAYVDHPSFGPAIIGRVLESHGYSVAILAQPDWKDPKSIQVYGEPQPGLPGLLRKYGFYGKSLFRVEKTPED